jgi:hypothetical protein
MKRIIKPPHRIAAKMRTVWMEMSYWEATPEVGKRYPN